MKLENHIRLINGVKKYGISISQYMELIEMLTKTQTSTNKETIRILIKNSIIKISNRKLNLTSKGEKLVSKVEKMFKPKKKTIKDILGDNYENQIKKYIETFPKLKLPNGKQARVSAKNLEKPMMWFFEENNYTWDIVLKATKAYVEEYRRANYKFMRTSQYFIRKQEVGSGFNSELSNYCEMITNNEAPEFKASIKSKVV